MGHGKVSGMAALGILFLGLAASLHAGGARETETRISLERPATYISPTGTIEANHALVVDKIKLEIDKNGSIKSYRFAVYDKAGKVVFEKSAAQLKGKGFLADAFGVGQGDVALPDSFSWDGQDPNGTRLADGEYFYQLSATDSWGATAASPPLSVVLDGEPPAIHAVEIDGTVVSPDGDGQRDGLIIRHLTGPAGKWIEEITGVDQAMVWRQELAAPGDTEATDLQMPETTTWKPVPEGAAPGTPVLAEGNYRYRITGLDRAGNAVTRELPFRVSYAGDAVSLATADGRTVFNPHGGLVFAPKVAETRGVVAWKLELKAKTGGAAWRQWGDAGLPPEGIAFTGRGSPGNPDQESEWLRDGEYLAAFSVRYESGTLETDSSLVLRADSLPPKAGLAITTREAPTPAGSPIWFGGDKRQLLSLAVTLEADLAWNLEIRRVDAVAGSVVAYRVPWAALAEAVGPERLEQALAGDWAGKLQWDGKLPAGTQALGAEDAVGPAPDAGATLPDGTWSVSLTATDPAGNTGGSRPVTVVRQSGPREAPVPVLSATEIQPGIQGAVDQVLVDPGIAQTTALEAIRLSALTADGTLYFTKEFDSTEGIGWQGQRSNGTPAPDGPYSLRLAYSYRNGDEQQVEAGTVTLAGRADRPAGAGQQSVRGDGGLMLVETPIMNQLDARQGIPVTFKFSGLEKQDQVKSWRLTLSDSHGRTVWEHAVEGGLPPSVNWSGLDAEGNALPGLAAYEARLELDDGTGPAPGSLVRTFTTGFRVAQEGSRFRILVPDILFAGDNADAFETDLAVRQENAETMRRLAEKLLALTSYRVIVEGHAVYVWGVDEASRAREQAEELLPLSRERAEQVRDLLFLQGLEWRRIGVVAKGGLDPAVPWREIGQLWKNRRVTLYLEE